MPFVTSGTDVIQAISCGTRSTLSRSPL